MPQIRAVHVEQDTYNPWTELAFSIVRQAVVDYKTLGKKYLNSPSKIERKHISDKMKSISNFFLESWYCILTGAENGPEILEALDQEVFEDD